MSEDETMDTCVTEAGGMQVRFWGVRGSLPAPGADTVLVGGNTSCVEIQADGARLVLDAGTGLRALGDELMRVRAHQEVHMLLSHVHWDHVMGLPFFAPLYSPDTTLHIASGPSGVPLGDLLRRQMSAPMFPVDISTVPSRVCTTDLLPGHRFAVGPFVIEVERLHHPDPVYAYRIEHGRSAVVYATDVEHGTSLDRRLAHLARGAELLVYDAQYTPEEYAGEDGPSKVGWGHSTYVAGAEIARAAGVSRLALFHHDPRRTDAQVSAIVQRARTLFPATVAAREGLSIQLAA